ncbi:MAG: histidyl-tRNA synthetase [candidate division Zixibacteria bacterium SM23_73_3]|nr:MAG: histidyl-tRNA synthetase [candidate division Zixibacteria bacterium SM23_73_3]
MKYKALYGTHDILPDDSFKWQYLEDQARKVFALYNYKEIRIPIFEETELFARSIGQDTDIVKKEMYTFTDQGKRSITLRPEATAGMVRAYLEHNLGEKSPLVKLYYLGSMFRQERPQKGRLREFHQFDIEAIGSADPAVDVEQIEMAVRICKELKISNFKLHLNSIGCPVCRPVHREKLLDFMKDKVSKLCDDCKTRYMRNPLRMFDCKKEGCIEQLQGAPVMVDFLCSECQTHYDQVKEYLKELNIDYFEDKRLVRGLDYYTKTAFEIKSPLLGSQDTLLGGGRYDLLVEELGGKSTPAIGFAAGMERFMLVMEMQKKLKYDEKKLEAKTFAVKLIRDLRQNNITCEMDYLQRSLKAQMKEANRQKAGKVLIIGEEEMKKGKAILRDMQSGEQQEIELADVGRICS